MTIFSVWRCVVNHKVAVYSPAVHGFSRMMYEQDEGKVAEIVFKRDVKGTTTFENLDLLLLGEITSEGQSAGE